MGNAAFLLAALALYFVPFELLAAYILACIIHELCHVLALKICNVKINSFRVELKGLVIEHGKISSALIELLCILSGPVGGIIFAYTCSMLSHLISSQWLEICSAVSLILSIFNLLPCNPLDGGKALRCVTGMMFTEKAAKTLVLITGLSVGAGFIFLSLAALRHGYGYGVAAAGMCIILNIMLEEGIVKISELR